jgi:hypothetical protein
MNGLRIGICLCLLSWGFAVRGELAITEAMSASRHANAAGNGDWWELYNAGTETVDLGGYSWDDNSAEPGAAGFKGVQLGAGEVLIICQETVGKEAAWRKIWDVSAGVQVVNLGNKEFQGLDAAGDEIHVYDPDGREVAVMSFGEAAPGYSFEWRPDGTWLGLSTLGDFGAYRASAAAGDNPDIGSPGLVAPTP